MPVVLYAGYMTLATAAFIFCSAASFSITMNVPQCVFSVGNGSFEAHYSHSFWLALATGGDEQQTQQTELHEMMHKKIYIYIINVKNDFQACCAPLLDSRW